MCRSSPVSPPRTTEGVAPAAAWHAPERNRRPIRQLIVNIADPEGDSSAAAAQALSLNWRRLDQFLLHEIHHLPVEELQEKQRTATRLQAHYISLADIYQEGVSDTRELIRLRPQLTKMILIAYALAFVLLLGGVWIPWQKGYTRINRLADHISVALILYACAGIILHNKSCQADENIRDHIAALNLRSRLSLLTQEIDSQLNMRARRTALASVSSSGSHLLVS